MRRLNLEMDKSQSARFSIQGREKDRLKRDLEGSHPSEAKLNERLI